MKKRPPEIYFLFFLLLFVSLNALAAGWAMITMPDGSVMHLTESRLSDSPFSNYLLPGVILFLFNGVFPMATLYGLIKKPDWSWAGGFNIYPDKHWSWACSLYSGVILIVWTTVQMFMVSYFWLQPAFVGVGLLIIIFTLLPRVMRFYSYQGK